MLKELVLKNRSYRRFYQNEGIEKEQLRQWIDLARLGASGRNAQSLRYLTVTNQEFCKKVFENLAWAGYLSDWTGPVEGEQPVAYVIMLNDQCLSKNYFCDDGIAVQNMMLGAVEDGYGGCILRAFKEKNIRELLNISEDYSIIQVVALGKPKEKVVLEEMKDENIKYWRDENGVHHVPKRILEDLVINEF
ncbi:MAG: nitroreductase [Ancylomarina sp.]|jgi:nitroreductase